MKSEAYLRFVRGCPCLVCGTPGTEAHHLQRVELSAMSKKPGDEWAVPLCRHHHQKLHDLGDEQSFWDLSGIDPKEWAIRHWEVWNGL